MHSIMYRETVTMETVLLYMHSMLCRDSVNGEFAVYTILCRYSVIGYIVPSYSVLCRHSVNVDIVAVYNTYCVDSFAVYSV